MDKIHTFKVTVVEEQTDQVGLLEDLETPQRDEEKGQAEQTEQAYYDGQDKDSSPKVASMPARRYYIVTQEREVKVAATNPLDAVLYASAAFNNVIMEEDQSIKPNILSEIRERELSVREEY